MYNIVLFIITEFTDFCKFSSYYRHLSSAATLYFRKMVRSIWDASTYCNYNLYLHYRNWLFSGITYI